MDHCCISYTYERSSLVPPYCNTGRVLSTTSYGAHKELAEILKACGISWFDTFNNNGDLLYAVSADPALPAFSPPPISPPTWLVSMVKRRSPEITPRLAHIPSSVKQVCDVIVKMHMEPASYVNKTAATWSLTGYQREGHRVTDHFESGLIFRPTCDKEYSWYSALSNNQKRGHLELGCPKDHCTRSFETEAELETQRHLSRHSTDG
ncbi:hypothetical protein BDZ85DRAFT_250013 [Elsinoe ampelina]|uniref:Uncharacterized protein n=1 Tax=Elsinoe ampelina TaxID=302913 RepID=A0A6A6GBG8_9PEZI|nr:hypothetical protein BDZ85DRAFT_250013 [Elsinoe ampelina]